METLYDKEEIFVYEINTLLQDSKITHSPTGKRD